MSSNAKIIDALRRLVREHGVRGAAHKLGLAPATVSRLLSGQRAPGPKVLDALGFVITYRKES